MGGKLEFTKNIPRKIFPDTTYLLLWVTVITVIFVSANAVRFGATQSKVIVSRQEVSGDRSISCLVVGGHHQRAPQLAWTNSAGFL